MAIPLGDRPLLVEDLAALLRKHRSTVRAMLESGAIPGGVKIGKRWYLSRENYDKLLSKPPVIDDRVAAILAALPPLTDQEVDDVVAIIRADRGA